MKSEFQKTFKILTIIVLLLCIYAGHCLAASDVFDVSYGFSENFGGNIVLGRPTDSSITVNVEFDVDQDEVYIEYGTDTGSYPNSTGTTTDVKGYVEESGDTTFQTYEQAITGLQADTRYYYRVVSTIGENTNYSDEHTFHTQRSKGGSFTFTIVADSHLFNSKHMFEGRYARAMKNVAADEPDFHIDLGDTFYVDHINSPDFDVVFERTIKHRPYFGFVTNSAPLFLVLGNHESEWEWIDLGCPDGDRDWDENLPEWETVARKALYPNPDPHLLDFYSGTTKDWGTVTDEYGVEFEIGRRESYYAWEWGDALFLVLDPYWENPTGSVDWEGTHGDDQYIWFKKILENSDAKWKFVFEHHIYGNNRGGVEAAYKSEWGDAANYPSQRPGWEKTMHQIMVDTIDPDGGSIYFQGHDHLYAVGQKDGVYYVECPMPGADSDDDGTADGPYFPDGGNSGAYDESDVVLNNSGHVRVKVAPTGLIVDYVSAKLDTDTTVNGDDGGQNGNVAHSFTIGDSYIPSYIPGDIDSSGSIDLKDIIISLQIASKTQPGKSVYSWADVNGDNKIGLEEAIYGMNALKEIGNF
ncbi:MAG: metallophosphoesterase [Deltaproteobacteria bacterium]|nr:metallophosphoesterase [Deltaproteobacteria bacterium]